MSNELKLNNAQLALKAPFLESRFCAEANEIAFVGWRLLDAFKSKELSEETAKEIDIITTGALVCALAYNQKIYASSNHTIFTYLSDDPASPLYDKLYYPKKFNELVTALNKEHQTFKIHENDTFLVSMIRDVGLQVMEGKLPFDLEVMHEIAPQHDEFYKALASRIGNQVTAAPTQPVVAVAIPTPTTAGLEIQTNSPSDKTPATSVPKSTDSQQINDIFEKALAASKPEEDKNNENKQKFITALDELNKRVLVVFNASSKKLLSKQDCVSIANSALELANKVGNHTLKATDIDQFIANTKQYRPKTALYSAIAAVISAVIGVLIGIGIGFACGGPVGAAIGAGVGLATCGLFGGGGMAYALIKNDPLLHMDNAAKAIAQENAAAPAAAMAG